MKLKYTALLLVLSSSIGTAFVANAEVVDGTVSITGEVVSQTCKVDNATAGNINVPLPKVSTTTLSSDGKTAGLTPFPITLTGCSAAATEGDSLESIGIYFSSYNVGNDGTLENTTLDGAKNVNIQLLDKNQKVIKLSDNAVNQVNYYQDLPASAEQKITFNYYAQYYSTGQSTAGKVTASVPFVIVYK